MNDNTIVAEQSRENPVFGPAGERNAAMRARSVTSGKLHDAFDLDPRNSDYYLRPPDYRKIKRVVWQKATFIFKRVMIGFCLLGLMVIALKLPKSYWKVLSDKLLGVSPDLLHLQTVEQFDAGVDDAGERWMSFSVASNDETTVFIPGSQQEAETQDPYSAAFTESKPASLSVKTKSVHRAGGRKVIEGNRDREERPPPIEGNRGREM